MSKTLNDNQKVFLRDQLRTARGIAMADAEGFLAVVRSLEWIGQQLTGKTTGLGDYERDLRELANASPLSSEIPSQCGWCHTEFGQLFHAVRGARNDAVHQGAYARALTSHAVELAIIFEDALMMNASRVSQYMVRDVVEAKPWHPVSYIRQQMLAHSFSCLPIQIEKQWKLVSESAVARYLRVAKSRDDRSKRLTNPVSEASEPGGLVLEEAVTVGPEDLLDEILDRIGTRPVVVVDRSSGDTLVGVLTSSDIL